MSLAAFIATRLAILFFVDPAFSDVRQPYFRYAVTAVDLHQTPYQGDFQIEYPPIAWWVMLLPRLANPVRVSDVQDASQMEPLFRSYRFGYRSLMLACDVLSFVVLLVLVRRAAPPALGWAALTYTVTTALLWPVLYDRLDAGLLFLLMLWALGTEKSLDGAIGWSTLAYGALGLSISFKIVPVIALPPIVLADLFGERAIERLFWGAAALVAGTCLPFAIQYALSGPEVFNLIGLHAGRGIQIESLYSTLMMLASLVGPEVAVGHGGGAYTLEGALAPFMKGVATAALIALPLGLCAWMLFRRALDRRTGYRFACYVIAAAIILSNVLSPQYLVWGLPLLVLLAAETMADRAEARGLLSGLLSIVAGLSTWLFPYNYFVGDVEPSSPYGIVPYGLTTALAPSAVGYVVLGARNAIDLAAVAWVGVAIVRIRPAVGSPLS